MGGGLPARPGPRTSRSAEHWCASPVGSGPRPTTAFLPLAAKRATGARLRKMPHARSYKDDTAIPQSSRCAMRPARLIGLFGRTQLMHDSPEKVLIVDFGSQVTQLIARRVRDAGVYSAIVPYQKAEAV